MALKEYADTSKRPCARVFVSAATRAAYVKDAARFEADCLDGRAPTITSVMEQLAPRPLREHWQRMLRDCFDDATGPAYRRKELTRRAGRATGGRVSTAAYTSTRNAKAAAQLTAAKDAEHMLSLLAAVRISKANAPRRKQIAKCKLAEIALGID